MWPLLISDRDACHEVTVEIPKVMAQLVEAVYKLCAHSGREDEVKWMWEEVGYTKMSWESLGIMQPQLWYAVFEKRPYCKYTRAPQVVIAVRGTKFTDINDLISDVRVIGQNLDGDKRYEHLQKVSDKVVEKYGCENVSITGHSLGAAFGILVGKVLAMNNRPVETFLFNPPFASLDIISNKSVRQVEKICKAMLLAIHSLVIEFDCTTRKRLILIRKEYLGEGQCEWTPRLFLNNGDLLSKGYINRYVSETADSRHYFMTGWLPIP